MNTATNIQLADRGPNEINENSNNREATIMKARSNIQGIIQNNTKILAGIIVGGMMAAAYMPPGNASADIPSRPVGDPGSTAYVSAGNAANVTDIDLIDPGFYDSKSFRTANTANLFDMDLIDPGFYDAKTVGASPGWEGLQTDNII